MCHKQLLLLAFSCVAIAAIDLNEMYHLGYACSTVNNKSAIFSFRNTSFYIYPNGSAVDSKTVLTCDKGFVVPHIDAIQFPVSVYPLGWTCKRGKFNRDLLKFLGTPVLDSELRELFSDYEFDGGDYDLDFICGDGSYEWPLRDDWSKLNLSMATVQPYAEYGKSTMMVTASCPDPVLKNNTIPAMWGNATAFGNNVSFYALSGNCTFRESRVWYNTGGCDSYKEDTTWCRGDLEELLARYPGNPNACTWQVLKNLANHNLSDAEDLQYRTCANITGLEGKYNLGYSTSINSTLASFSLRNKTHYIRLDGTAVPYSANGYNSGFFVPRNEAVQPCQVLYPSGWTCKNGTFNRDLLTFTGTPVVDCELRKILLLYAKGGDGLDFVCDQSNEDGWAHLNLSMATVQPYIKYDESTKMMNAWCAPPGSKINTVPATWANDTCFGDETNTFLLSQKCTLSEGRVWSNAGGCDSFREDTAWCRGSLKKLLASEYIGNPNACTWLELKSLAAEDIDEAEKLHKQLCQSARTVSTSTMCSSKRQLHRFLVKLDTASPSTSFHIHHLNTQNVLYYDATPSNVSKTMCSVENNWNRNFYPFDTPTDNIIDTTLIRCSTNNTQDRSNVHISGTFRGSLRIEGKLSSMGVSNTCPIVNSTRFTRVSARAVCMADFFVTTTGNAFPPLVNLLSGMNVF